MPSLPRDHTWTGDGFVRANERTQFVFKVENLAQSMHYSIVIRYEPPMVSQTFADETVTALAVADFMCLCYLTSLLHFPFHLLSLQCYETDVCIYYVFYCLYLGSNWLGKCAVDNYSFSRPFINGCL